MILAATLIAAACGSGTVSPEAASTTTSVAISTTAVPTTAAPTTTLPTTTAAPSTTIPSVTATDLAADGPWEVGVTTRTLPTGNLVEIYYPSTAAAVGLSEEYHVSDFLPEAIAALIPPDTPDSFTVRAARDAPGAPEGPFPVVLFSHGFSGFRLQSTTILRHLASWGMVVASPDHPQRDLAHIIGDPTEATPVQPAVDDLRASLQLLGDVAGDPVLDNIADMSRVALGGHSAGGFTILEMAADHGIAGYVSYASGAGDRPDMPAVPSLFLSGANDTVIQPSATGTAFASAPSPSTMWTIGAAGHLAFSDLCLIGGGANLIDLAEAAGIGALIPDNLRRLATDGCEPPNRPVGEVFPAILQASTGFYRWVFGIDAQPIGLSATAVPDVVIASH